MRAVKGQINIDKLKVCFRTDEAIVNNLKEQFNHDNIPNEDACIYDFVDFRLVYVSGDEDKMTVALDIPLEQEEWQRMGAFTFYFNGKYAPYCFFLYENRALYTPFYSWANPKNSIASMLEYAAQVIGLQFNNITSIELALDTNQNILSSVRRAIRNHEQLDMIVNGRKVSDPFRKIENYTEAYSSSRTRLLSSPTLYIRQKKDEGLRLKVYNKTREMATESPAKNEYIPEWNNTGKQVIYRAELTIRNEDITEFCRQTCTPREEAFFWLTTNNKWRAGLYQWCVNRLLHFTDRHTDEQVDIIETLAY